MLDPANHHLRLPQASLQVGPEDQVLRNEEAEIIATEDGSPPPTRK